MVMGANHENFYVEVVNKWGSWKEFIDHTSPRVTGKLDLNIIDVEMHEIIQLLNDNKLYTVSCCCGHGERSACIIFDTTIAIDKIIKILNHSEVYTIVNETVTQLFGEECIYYRLHFNYNRLHETFKPLYENLDI